MAVEAFFLPARQGRRYTLIHAPQGTAVRGLVVHAPAFAEEMNKSRRMVAMQSRALAAAGYAVIRSDLFGCGDSSGDFADATWAGWVDDLHLAAATIRQRHPGVPLWWWGQRAGCLLAHQAALGRPDGDDDAPRLLLWQPPASGKLLLQQFLRLRAAAEMAGGDAKAAMESVKRELAAGRAVDIAGYALPAAVASGLEQATLAPPAGGPAKATLLWLEVSSGAEAPQLLPASLPRIEAWRAAGHAVHTRAVAGPSFWQTTEIEDAPALVDATLALLEQAA